MAAAPGQPSGGGVERSVTDLHHSPEAAGEHPLAHLHSSALTVTAPGYPVPFASASTHDSIVDMLLITPKKIAGDNTSAVFLGDFHIKNNVYEGIELHYVPGVPAADVGFYPWTFPIPPGHSIDLAELYLDAEVSGDGVVYMYAHHSDVG